MAEFTIKKELITAAYEVVLGLAEMIGLWTQVERMSFVVRHWTVMTC